MHGPLQCSWHALIGARGIRKAPLYAWHSTCRVLLEDIIDNLARDGEHYATCSLSFAIGESEPLFGRSIL